MIGFYLVTLLAVAPTVPVNPATFTDAKALASRDEGSLSNNQKDALTSAQAPVIATALSTCLPVNASKPASFVVVAELDATGAVRKTWRSSESNLSVCFQTAVSKAKLNVPPRSPFYSSFDLNFTPTNSGH